jgi:hypothetical protein
LVGLCCLAVAFIVFARRRNKKAYPDPPVLTAPLLRKTAFGEPTPLRGNDAATVPKLDVLKPLLSASGTGAQLLSALVATCPATEADRLAKALVHNAEADGTVDSSGFTGGVRAIRCAISQEIKQTLSQQTLFRYWADLQLHTTPCRVLAGQYTIPCSTALLFSSFCQ